MSATPVDLTRPHATSAEEIVHSFEEADDHGVVDLSIYAPEDWLTLAFFWTMAALVFLQFFSRYVLNDSYAWTEELAVYCLISIVFVGSSMCVRTDRHIHVDFLYRYLPRGAGRALASFVDIVRTAFFAYGAWLVYRYVGLVGEEPMTTIAWNKSYVYWIVFGAFVLMTLRSLQVGWRNLRRGWSVLERPELAAPVEG